MKRATILLLAMLAACSNADRPDESGLTQAQKVELVERYYACAQAGDAVCVQATLHPDFRALEGDAFIPRGPHALQLASVLEQSRVEARILPHEGGEIWVAELWTSRHGQNRSMVQSFLFRDRLIRQKSGLGS